jgi:hypothetical protein
MKELIVKIRKALRRDTSEVFWIQIPATFKSEKDKTFFIRRTKDFIKDKTKVI